MTNRQAWIAVGVAGAVLAFGYLATQREIHATVVAGDASIVYKSDLGAAGAPNPQEDSHARMVRLIDESNAAITAYDVGD
jgi:hypothetical protein